MGYDHMKDNNTARTIRHTAHTDLALELQEELESDGMRDQREQRDSRSFGSGIHVEKRKREGGRLKEAIITVTNEEGERILGKPKGVYITLEGVDLADNDGAFHEEMSTLLAQHLEKLLGSRKKILVAGLGNREVTPDALGPRVVDNLFITRHILNEFGTYAFQREDVGKVSGIVPGVMAQTGMECVEILKGVVKETKPDFLITVDALAARSIRRLGRTIQLTDTGITPGSGIGNHRNAINRKSVGVPVISLGVPTVVDAATIVSDAMTEFISALSLSDLQKLDERERQELARELLSPQLNGLFVTPKNIDDSIKNLSFLISEGLNIALLGDKEE